MSRVKVLVYMSGFLIRFGTGQCECSKYFNNYRKDYMIFAVISVQSRAHINIQAPPPFFIIVYRYYCPTLGFGSVRSGMGMSACRIIFSINRRDSGYMYSIICY